MTLGIKKIINFATISGRLILSMSKHIKIRKGLDIKLQGEAERVFLDFAIPDTCVIKPTDFHGIRFKLIVKKGDEVKAGSPLLYDRDREEVLFTSPVSGEVVEIRLGEKRKILEVKILADKEIKYVPFNKADPNKLSRAEIIENLLKSGAWPLIRQRPYDIIADPKDPPKAIFISAFDSAPLAPDNDFIIHGKGDEFQAGLDVLAKLTSGKIHLNVKANTTVSKVFTNAKHVQVNSFSGPHPAGNVGVQINHIDPINKGDKVWYLQPQDVLVLGRLFLTGRFDATRIVALTGSGVKKRKYYKTVIGGCIKQMVQNNINGELLRYISGNVLTGTKISQDGYLGFYDKQITVIPEGIEPRFMGWLAPNIDKFSHSGTFFSWLMPGKKYNLNTNKNGEERPYVITGEYEKVFPMNIYPVHLIKGIMIGDIEQIENLGIYEVVPEDFALCEFVCTSKIPLQKIIREGLDLVKKECG